jgi:hypothetical protein
MTKPVLGDLSASLGYDLLRVWASSFTMDEHEAFALVYRALGGRIPTDGVRLTFHRHGFRRAGQGVMPRRWLRPFNVPSETPLPTYHPKLILAETSERQHIMFISTANLAPLCARPLEHRGDLPTWIISISCRPRADAHCRTGTVCDLVPTWTSRSTRPPSSGSPASST